MSRTTYVVRCEHPDGGDVIEGRAAPVESEHTDREAAFGAADKWHRVGPNGPVRTAEVYAVHPVTGSRSRVGRHDVHWCPEPVRLETYLLAGWWHCRGWIRGRAVAASIGASPIAITADDALVKGRQWAEWRGYAPVEATEAAS